LQGVDVLVRSPTGSGKTLAFVLPIVERTAPGDARPSALVLVPTRELASQVTEDFQPLAKARALTVAPAYGGVPLKVPGQPDQDADILVATPGRLEDLANRRLVNLSQVRTFVLDEADRMLDMGFKPQVDKLVRRLPRNRQTMFFSATLDGEVGELARKYTTGATRIEGELSALRQPGEIEHRFISVTADSKVETLLAHIREGGSTLVFVRTKRGADRLVQKLKKQGVAAVAMHGDMSQNARERALARFESGKVATLVATDVAAARARPRRRHARDQLRPAGRGQGLRPPDGPHRPRRAQRHGDHLRPARAAGRHEPRRAAPRPSGAVRRRRHAIGAREARLHEPPRTPIEVVAV
jgi:superfamily II DNA/RNA helicase